MKNILAFLGIVLLLAIGYSAWVSQTPVDSVTMRCTALENKRKLVGGLPALTFEEREYEKKNCDMY